MLTMIIGMYFLAASQAVQAPAPTCLPPFWGGVLAGSSVKGDVLKLYGRGIFVSKEGDTGGSYYRDAKGTVTLHAVYYTDTVVGDLEVIEGNAIPLNARQRPEAVSPYLKPPFLHAGLAFGSTEEAVLSSMGQPARREKGEDGLVTFVYQSSCRCNVEAGISFVFRKGRLIKAVYWNEPG
jgi:hypothetical protein